MSERYNKIWFSKDDKVTVGLVFSDTYLRGKSVSDIVKLWTAVPSAKLGKIHNSPWHKSWVDAWMHDEEKSLRRRRRR